MTAEFITGGDELFKAAEDCGSIISPDKTFIADKTSVCAFSGHRLLGQDFDRALLERIAEGIMKRGYRTFLCGMAKGFDLVAAETVLKLKGIYDAELIACIPYAGQAEYFSLSDRERYENILKYCSKKIIFSEIFLFLKKVKKSLRTHICAHTRRPAEGPCGGVTFLCFPISFVSLFV